MNKIIYFITFVGGIIIIALSDIPEIGLALIIFEGFLYLGSVMEK